MTHPSTEARLRGMLEIARDQFQRYGDLHLQKDPPQHDKARTNYDLVKDINDTLLNAHTLPDEYDAAFEQFAQEPPIGDEDVLEPGDEQLSDEELLELADLDPGLCPHGQPGTVNCPAVADGAVGDD